MKINIRAFMALCCLAAGLAAYAQRFEIQGIEYEIQNPQKSECKLSPYEIKIVSGKNASGKVVIPDFVEYNGGPYFVTRIADRAFKKNKGIKEVEIASTVYDIGKDAFRNCDSLRRVAFRDAFTECGALWIGHDCFSNDDALEEILLPNKTVDCEAPMAIRSRGLKLVRLPDDLRMDGGSAKWTEKGGGWRNFDNYDLAGKTSLDAASHALVGMAEIKENPGEMFKYCDAIETVETYSLNPRCFATLFYSISPFIRKTYPQIVSISDSEYVEKYCPNVEKPQRRSINKK